MAHKSCGYETILAEGSWNSRCNHQTDPWTIGQRSRQTLFLQIQHTISFLLGRSWVSLSHTSRCCWMKHWGSRTHKAGDFEAAYGGFPTTKYSWSGTDALTVASGRVVQQTSCLWNNAAAVIGLKLDTISQSGTRYCWRHCHLYGGG